ncbi:MAG: fructosamine kinase family protein [Candidatus Bipolaricaulis sp.]|nr:fructosamine kinase family protein [Candidatus Bipolaricaulis sp.]
MTPKHTPGVPGIRSGPIPWLTAPLRTSIEEAASAYEGRPWRIRSEADLSEFACHRCALVSDGRFSVFFKYSEMSNAGAQFEAELSGLKTLSTTAGVLIPEPIGIVPVEGGTLLVLEALEAVERGPREWREIGATLGRIHRVRGDACGLGTNGFFGPLTQDNAPAPTWADFFAQRRLLPLLKTAVDSGHLPLAVSHNVERLLPRLPDLCGPEAAPRLLHGDAQQNNFISTAAGTFVIDPAVYYGNPEIDLALVDAFQPAPDAVFAGYQDEAPIDPGFFERRDLWRLPLYLAAVALEGPDHLCRLKNALRKYV